MKLEPRGKYAGVKVHLDGEEVQTILNASKHLGGGFKSLSDNSGMLDALEFVTRLGKKIQVLMEKEPELLTDRTPEQVAAILAKEVEKASLQLNAVKSGKMWQKVDPEALQAALLKHVHKE